jgi:hypothetical protein
MAPVREALLSASKSAAPATELTTSAYYLSFSDDYFRDINAAHGSNEAKRGAGMAGKTVVVRLNQQQLELLDRTIERGETPDRVSLIRKALREQAAKPRNGGAR